MKKLLLPFALGIVVLVGLGAGVKISDLALSTSPSTNTFMEIADLDASGTNKSAKILYTNLVTQSQLLSAGGNLWTSYTAADAEGGTIYGTASTNSFLPAQVNFAANYLTNFWADYSTFLSIGYSTPVLSTLAAKNAEFFSIGDYAASNTQFTNSSIIYSIGNNATADSNGSNNFAIFNIGVNNGGNTRYRDCAHIFNLNDSAGYGSPFESSDHIFNCGTAAGAFGAYISCSRIMNLGDQANTHSKFTNKTEMVAICGLTTNSFDFVIGTGIHNFVANVASFASTVKVSAPGFDSTATDAAVSGTSAGWTNTFGKAAVIRFDGSALIYTVYNNALTTIYTNTVSAGHGIEIIQTSGKILFTGGTVSQWVAAPF